MVIQAHMEVELLQHLVDSGLLVGEVLDYILLVMLEMVDLVVVRGDLLPLALVLLFQKIVTHLQTPEVVEVELVELVEMDRWVVEVVLVLLLFIMILDK
tara:strand:- start:5 stop:301 length:297 start_codon:yes stop_codon:yes gene_type:complete